MKRHIAAANYSAYTFTYISAYLELQMVRAAGCCQKAGRQEFKIHKEKYVEEKKETVRDEN